ncbi:beta-lactamase/transpeptidase-like protein [Hyaloraphidium curvatum]|nr:beta-lactamase/transpeptidase-like protein [Hyaloraphidium curvatum]
MATAGSAPDQPVPDPIALPRFPPQPPGVPFPTAEWPRHPTGADGLPDIGRPYDRARLKALLEKYDADVRDGKDGHLALVVVQGGKIVAERYNASAGTTEDTKLISWSTAKSFAHYMVGRIVQLGQTEGFKSVEESLKTPLRTVLKEWSAPGDPRGDITMGDLLRMRAGLDFLERYTLYDDAGKFSIPDVVRMLFLDWSSDVSLYALSAPPIKKPGSSWYYSSGTSNIVCRACFSALGLLPTAQQPVRRSWLGFAGRFFFPVTTYLRFRSPQTDAYVNAPALSWLRRNLFDPIGMESAEPKFDAAGVWIASSFLFAAARDYARFGLLYLRDGVWEGERLLPAGWCETARQRSAVNYKTEELFDYGMHWWIPKDGYENRGWFMANGYQGQMILVAPAADMIVVRLGRTESEEDFGRVFKEVVQGAVECFEGPKGK